MTALTGLRTKIIQLTSIELTLQTNIKTVMRCDLWSKHHFLSAYLVWSPWAKFVIVPKENHAVPRLIEQLRLIDFEAMKFSSLFEWRQIFSADFCSAFILYITDRDWLDIFFNPLYMNEHKWVVYSDPLVERQSHYFIYSTSQTAIKRSAYVVKLNNYTRYDTDIVHRVFQFCCDLTFSLWTAPLFW